MSDYLSAASAALRALGPDLGNRAATKIVAAQEANSVHVPYIIAIELLVALSARYGFPIIADNKIPLTNGHGIMGIDRAVIRDLFETVTKARTTPLPTLYLGSAHSELAKYYANRDSHFWFHLSEGKDGVRSIMPVLESFLLKFRGYQSSNSTVDSKHGKLTGLRLDIQNIEQLLHSYEVAAEEEFAKTRIHMTRPEGRFVRIVAQDCAYEISEYDWFMHFSKHDAAEAYVTGFYPDELIFPQTQQDPTYVYSRTVRSTRDAYTDVAFLGTVVAALVRLHCASALTTAAAVFAVAKALASSADGDPFEVILTSLVAFAADGATFYLELALVAHAMLSAFQLHDRASVTYRHDGSNGYEHPWDTWSLLMRKVVLESPAHDFVIEVELLQTAGSHRMFRLVRSSSPRPVTRAISIPEQLEPIQILDVEATFATPVPTPVYFVVSKREYEQTINFLAGQMDTTLTFEGVQTLINRAAGGVKIATTEVTPAWTMQDSVKWKFAVTCALQAQRMHGRAKALTNDHKEVLRGFNKQNWQWLLKTLGLGFAVVATAGLAVPVFVVYQWLATTYSQLELVKPCDTRSVQRWVPSSSRVARLRNAVLPTLHSEVINLKHQANDTCACLTLERMKPFGAQRPRCLHKPGEEPREMEIEITAEELAELRAHIFTEREKAPEQLRVVLDRFMDSLPKTGVKFKLTCHLIIGGPGTGKSHTARQLLSAWERATNQKTLVYAPFNKLAPDYPSEPKDGNIGFTFRTTHRLVQERGVGVVLCDEFTAMEERVALISMFLAGTTTFIALGDNHQTGVRPNEGVRFFSPGSKFRMSDFHKHILTVNFRNSAYAVALANVDFQAGMYANSDDIRPPMVRPLASFPSNSNDVTISFTEMTGNLYGLEEQSNSVRKNQGQTCKNVNIPVMTRDVPMVLDDPLFLVALTRNKTPYTLTFYCEDGPAMTAVRQRLRLDDEEFQKNVLKHARPDIDALYGKTELVSNAAEFNALAQELFQTGVLTAADAASYEARTEVVGRTLEEVVEWVTQEVKTSHCDRCGENQEDVCMCSVEDKDEEIAFTIEEYKTAVDFTEEGWCLPIAATTPVVQPQPHKAKALAAYQRAGPVTYPALPLDLFTDYKEHARRHGHIEGRGHNTPVLVAFLQEHGQRYIVEVLHDGRDTVEDYYVHNPSIDEPTAYVTVRAGHATVMSYDRVADYMSTGKYSVPLPDGELREFVVPKHVTWRHIQDEMPQHKLSRRFIDLDMPVREKLVGERYVFVLRTVVGRKPVWAEKFIVPFTSAPATTPSGPRTFSLDSERHRPVLPIGVETQDANYTRDLPNDRLHGTDAYLLSSLYDITRHSTERANERMVDCTLTSQLKLYLKPASLINPLNSKKQPLLGRAVMPAWAVSAGFGLVQDNNPTEALACAQRYLKHKTSSRYSESGARAARAMAVKNFVENYDQRRVHCDRYLEDAILAGWETDARSRSYAARLEADFRSGNAETGVNFQVKRQCKVSKKPYVDPMKIGQGISAVSPSTNYLYGPLFRVLNYRMSAFANPWNIYDCGMSEVALKSDVREQMKGKVFDTCTTIDVTECDANQNWFTALGDQEFWRLICDEAWLPTLDRYFRDVRGAYKIKIPSLMSATVDGPKASGAPDTLPGNTLSVENYSNFVLKFRGPRVVVKKGDDRTVWSTSVEVDKAMIRELAHYTDFNIDISFGRAQFTGKVVVANGMYDDVVKRGRKALMQRSIDYKHWTEFQESLRDFTRNVIAEGLQPTLAAAMEVYSLPYEQVQAWWQIVYSLSHISYAQWCSVVSDRSFALPPMPSVRKSDFPDTIHRAVTSYAEHLMSLRRPMTKVERKELLRRLEAQNKV